MYGMMVRLVAVAVVAGLLAGCVAVVPLGETTSQAKTIPKQKS